MVLGAVGQSTFVQHVPVVMQVFDAGQYVVPGAQPHVPPAVGQVVSGAVGQSTFVQHVPFAMHVFEAAQ